MTWHISVPATSGRLLLSLVYDSLVDGLPCCAAPPVRADWKADSAR